MNPFGDLVVQTPWVEPAPIDLPGINRAATDAVRQTVAEVAHRPDRSRLMLLLGAAGIGKTHLLARVRQQLIPSALFVASRPSPDGSRPYRDLLAHVFGDLARVAADGPDQLTHLIAAALASHDAARRWPMVVIEDLKRDGKLWRRNHNARLLSTAEQFEGIDTEVLDRILRLPFEPDARRELMWWWLAGSPLDVEQFYSLGLDGNIEDEEQAREVLLTLCGLAAGARMPIVVSFDQLETLDEHPNAPDSFGKLISELVDSFPGLVVTLVARPETWTTQLEPQLGLHFEGVHDRIVELTPPRRAQAVALARSRVGTRGLDPMNEHDVEAAWSADPRPRSMLDALSRAWNASQRAVTVPTPIATSILETPAGTNGSYSASFLRVGLWGRIVAFFSGALDEPTTEGEMARMAPTTTVPPRRPTSLPAIDDFFAEDLRVPVNLQRGVDVRPPDSPTVDTLASHLADAIGLVDDEADRELFVALHRSVKKEGIQLPAIPGTVMRIQRLVSSPTCRVEDLAAELSNEPGLATKMIGIANSPFYIAQIPCRSVRDAVMRVGLFETRSIVLTIACRSKIFRIPGHKDLADALYRRSIATAHATRTAAAAFGADVDDGFIAGLVHDLGRIVIHSIAADVHFRTKGRLTPQIRTIDKLADQLGPAIAALIAETWNLDPKVIKAVEWQHYPQTAPPASMRLTAALHDGKLLAAQLEPDAPPRSNALAMAIDAAEIARLKERVDGFA